MASVQNDSIGAHAGLRAAHGVLPGPGQLGRSVPLAAAAAISAVAAGVMLVFCRDNALTVAVGTAVASLTALTWRLAANAERAANARTRSEENLRASEERLRLATESAGIATTDVDLRTGAAIWSTNRFELFGYPPCADGRASVQMWRRCIHPDDLEPVMQALDTARRERRSYAMEYRIRRADDGQIVWLRACGRFHYDERGEAARFTGVSFNDTERKLAKLNDEFLFQLDERLRYMTEADAILDEGIASLGRHLGVAHCLFGEKNIWQGTERIRRRWNRPGVPPLAAKHYFSCYLTPETWNALNGGESVAIADMHNDARTSAHSRLFITLGVGAYVTVPYMREGQCQARIAVLADAPRRWREDEVELMRKVLARIWPLAANARATQALRASERRERERAAELETLLETVPATVLIAHDPDCRRVTGNRAANDVLRLRQGQQASLTAAEGERPMHYKVHAGDRELAGHELPLQRAARGFAVKDFEETIVFGDGTTRHLLGNAVPLRDEHNRLRGAIAAYIDITERRRAEHAHAQLAAVVEASGDAIISRGLDRTILSWNPAAEKLFGWSAEEAIGRSIRITTPPESWGTRDMLLDRVKNGETIGSVETLRVRKDGTRFFGDVTYSPVTNAQGSVVSIATVVRDTTARRQFEEALREYAQRLETLSHQLVEVQERERAAIARELHDQLGQTLGAAKLRLQVVRRNAAAQPFHRALEEVIAALSEALQETRTLALSLRPPQLDDLGLEQAVRLYAERLAAASHIKVHFPVSSLPAVPTPLDISCYRVAQEALQNIIRHASAQNVWIDLSVVSDMLCLAVRDDGKGCDLAAVRARARQGHSMGLLNMEERVALAGGSIQFSSHPGQGMAVHATFPVSRANGAMPGHPSPE